MSIDERIEGITLGQVNWKKCGPPPGNKFGLDIDQRSRLLSPHGANRKGLSQ